MIPLTLSAKTQNSHIYRYALQWKRWEDKHKSGNSEPVLWEEGYTNHLVILVNINILFVRVKGKVMGTYLLFQVYYMSYFHHMYSFLLI